MCLLQLGNSNLKPLYFVSLLPPLALLSAVWIVDAISAGEQRIRLVGHMVAAAVAIALVLTFQQTLRSRGVTPPTDELISRLSVIQGLAGERVLTWPPGSHAAQTLAFYLPETRFVRVIDEPRNVREAQEALRRGAFRFIIVEVVGAGPRAGEPPALWSNYRPLFEILGRSEADGFEVWRRR